MLNLIGGLIFLVNLEDEKAISGRFLQKLSSMCIFDYTQVLFHKVWSSVYFLKYAGDGNGEIT